MKQKKILIAVVACCCSWVHAESAQSLFALYDEIELHPVKDIYSLMDVNADPCDDFWRYACGGFIDSQPPLSKAPFQRSYVGDLVRQRNIELLKGIVRLGEIASDISFELEPSDLSAHRNILKPFFDSCRDEETIESLGFQPFEEALAPISEMVLFDAIAYMHRLGLDAFFSVASRVPVNSQEFLKTYMKVLFVFKNTSFTKLKLDVPLEPRDFETSIVAENAREDKCVALVDQYLWKVLDRPYAYITVDDESVAMVQQMNDQIRNALKRRILGRNWMDAQSIAMALSKIDHMVDNIASPENFPDYGHLVLDRKKFLFNVLNVRDFGFQSQLQQIGLPVDRKAFSEQLPLTAWNAFYQPALNSITILPTELQFPMFSKRFPAAMNYGALGRVIGHEISHGFDVKGRRFDAHGNLNIADGRERPSGWWSQSSSNEFMRRSECLAGSFSRLSLRDEKGSVIESLHIDGQKTLGENIADVAGIKIAYDAYQTVEAERHDQPSDKRSV